MTRYGLRYGSLLAILCGSLLCAAQTKNNDPRSQQSSSPGTLVFKSSVRRVIVDVVVRDRDGKPVHGLARNDFSVFEDGKPQHIVSFDVFDLDKPSISLPPNAPALPPNVFVNVPTTPESGPLYVILYDMVNMDMDDQVTARQQTLRFIGSKPAGTRFALFVHSDGLHLVQGFTDDKDVLYAALDPRKPPPHLPKSFLMGANFGRNDPISSMSVLTHIGEFLDGLPGRKNLIWMAGMFPVALYPHEGDPQDFRDDIKRELDALTRAQVAIYPVNIRGVVINPEGALTGTTPYGGSSSVASVPGASGGGGGGGGGRGASSGGTAGSGPPASTPPSQTGLQTASSLQFSGVSRSLSSDYAVEDDVATATGGQAFYSTNDLKTALTEATEDGASYYSLSYAPANPIYSGNLRTIRVALSKPGLHLSYRRSYYADDPDQPIHEKPKKNLPEDEMPEQAAVKARERPLYASLQHGAPPLHGLIFKVRVHAVSGPTLATAAQMEKLSRQPAYLRGARNPAAKLPKDVQLEKYAIYYIVASKQIKLTQPGRLPLEFAAVAFNSDGWVVNGVFEQAAGGESTTPFPEGEAALAGSGKSDVYRAMQELDVPIGATSMRIAVRDLYSDRVGAMEIALPLAPEKESEPDVMQPASQTK